MLQLQSRLAPLSFMLSLLIVTNSKYKTSLIQNSYFSFHEIPYHTLHMNNNMIIQLNLIFLRGGGGGV